jgi:hypothetical protein
MKTAVFASTREGAGKTSIIAGIMSSLKDRYGYIKPFGDRLIYRRKRNWDYDSNLIIELFGLTEEPESITLGFDHSKLRYVYNEDSVKNAVIEMAKAAGASRDGVFIEGGKDISYGASIFLDPISLARYTESSLVLVVSGENDAIVDDLRMIKRNLNLEGIKSVSVIVNKVFDLDEFEDLYLKEIETMGFNVLGIIPFKEQLTHYTISFLAEKLYAKVIAGEKGMSGPVKNIFVGAMSTDESLRNPLFNKESKFLITSGDRSDMILAAMESETAGILLTNNILPPSNIIARAAEKNIPLLLVTMDTFQAARQIDRMEALLTGDNTDRLRLLSNMAEKYLKIESMF